jgi:broad specificity phosphatase PhoE
MKIFLIRHGESIANAKGIHQGQRYDVGLSEKGKEQAKKLAERLGNEKIEAIYASDLKRAHETAEEINKPHKLKIILDKRLREFDTGDWTDKEDKWKVWADYQIKEAKKLGIKTHEVKMPGGESNLDHVLRTKEFLKEVEAKHNGNIIVVAHGGSNKIFFGVVGHTPMDKIYENNAQDNTGLNVLEKEGKTWKAHLINCTKHLR